MLANRGDRTTIPPAVIRARTPGGYRDVGRRSRTPTRARGESPRELSLVDCDAHHNWRGPKDVLPYLPRYWADYVVESQFKSLPNSPYPKGVGGGERVDARPGDVGSAGSDVDLFRRQLLDEWGVDVAILTGQFYNVAFSPTPDLPRRCRARSTTG